MVGSQLSQSYNYNSNHFIKDVSPFNTWGEAVCMYSQTGIRCTFIFHDWEHHFHKYVLWQPRTGLNVLGVLPTNDYPSYHPARSKINRMERDDESNTSKSRQTYQPTTRDLRNE